MPYDDRTGTPVNCAGAAELVGGQGTEKARECLWSTGVAGSIGGCGATGTSAGCCGTCSSDKRGAAGEQGTGFWSDDRGRTTVTGSDGGDDGRQTRYSSTGPDTKG